MKTITVNPDFVELVLNFAQNNWFASFFAVTTVFMAICYVSR